MCCLNKTYIYLFLKNNFESNDIFKYWVQIFITVTSLYELSKVNDVKHKLFVVHVCISKMSFGGF